MEERKLTVAIDFDNTIATEKYPAMGDLIPGAKETIKWLYDNGHTIIIDTCRTGAYQEDAISFLNRNNIPWHYFNHNDPKRITKYGNDSRKISCDVVIDDKNIESLVERDVVDWDKIRKMFERLINPKPIVVCVVGESATGKTHMVEYMRSLYGIKMIESYTDRPKRSEGEVGHTFLTKEEFDDIDMREMIAFTCWLQGDGTVARYCCLEEDVDEPIQFYVIDERGLKYLRKYWSRHFRIFAVRMFASDSERIKRAGTARASRDDGLFSMTADKFDYFIDNDYSPSMYRKYDALYERIKKL